jgi:hypothetical protein
MRDVSEISLALAHLFKADQNAAARAEARRFTATNGWRREEEILAHILERVRPRSRGVQQ